MWKKVSWIHRNRIVDVMIAASVIKNGIDRRRQVEMKLDIESSTSKCPIYPMKKQ